MRTIHKGITPVIAAITGKANHRITQFKINSSTKGITPVIAVILLLLITISIVGIAFTFFQRTTEAATTTGSRQIEQQVSQIGTQFAIEGADKNQVHIRNLGTTSLAGLAFFVDNNPVAYAGPASLLPDAVGTYFLNDSQLAMLPDPARLRVTSAGASDEITADFYGNYDAAYWKFDEGSGKSAADSSGNGNDGTLANNPTWTTGQVGSALSFDGVDDSVTVSSSNSLKIQEHTVSFWIKFTNNPDGSYRQILAKYAPTTDRVPGLSRFY